MMKRSHSLRLCLLLGAALGLAGCQAVSDNGRYAVTAMKAPFYKYGPAQAFGADFALVRGQHLTMVERGFGFSRVLTDDGVSGFVSTDDIVSSPDPVPKPQARVASRRGGSSRGPGAGSSVRRKPAAPFVPDGGLFNLDDVPLPTDPEPPRKPEAPGAKPEPGTAAKPEPKPDEKPASKPSS